MKHALLFSALSFTLLCSNISHAQLPGFTLGIKAGANFQQLDGVSFEKAYNAGIVGGAFAGVTTKKIGVQLEGLVKSAKVDVKPVISTSPKVTVSCVYLDVPLLLEYKLFSRLWIQAGPQFTSLISAKSSATGDVKKTFNSSEFSAVAGLQANLPFHLTVGGRYILGLTDVNNTSVSGTKDAWKNRSIQLYLGFRFL